MRTLMLAAFAASSFIALGPALAGAPLPREIGSVPERLILIHDQSRAMSGETAVGSLFLSGAWARAMLPGQPAGGAYMSITNEGGQTDRLVSVTSPAAGKVEIHTMEMKDEVMVMRPLEGGLDIPGGETVEMKPGGIHLMFMQVGEPFAEGSHVPVTLEFEKAGTVELMLPVRSADWGRKHAQ